MGDCGTTPAEQDWDTGRPSWLGGPAHPGDALSGVAGGGSSLLDVLIQVLHGMNIWHRHRRWHSGWHELACIPRGAGGPHQPASALCVGFFRDSAGPHLATPELGYCKSSHCTAPQQQGLHAASRCFWNRGELWADSISSCWSIQTSTGACVYCSCRKAGLQGS